MGKTRQQVCSLFHIANSSILVDWDIGNFLISEHNNDTSYTGHQMLYDPAEEDVAGSSWIIPGHTSLYTLTNIVCGVSTLLSFVAVSWLQVPITVCITYAFTAPVFKCVLKATSCR